MKMEEKIWKNKFKKGLSMFLVRKLWPKIGIRP